MKNNLLTSLLFKTSMLLVFMWFIKPINAKAQSTFYNFLIEETPYQPLTGNTTDAELEPFWDDEIFPINLPFSISMFGFSPFTMLAIETNPTVYNMDAIINQTSPLSVYSPSGIDLVYKDESTKVHYLISGTAPQRKLEVEFLNAGFYGFDDSIQSFTQKFTVYENGCFSSHFGPYQLPNDFDDFAIIGVYSQQTDTIGLVSQVGNSYVYLEGNLASFGKSGLPSLYPLPSTGTLFTLCRSSAVALEASPATGRWQVFPNPSQGILYFSELPDNAVVSLYNMAGQCVYHASHQGQFQLDFSHFPAGMYQITLNASGMHRSLKWVKH